MTTWSTPALLLLGIAAGPYGLNLLTPQILLLLDPGIAMAVAMLGVFVGLSFDFRKPSERILDVVLILAGGVLVAALRDPAPGAAIGFSAALGAVSASVAIAGWLLVGQTPSEGEQHVFVVGALLLMGGAATYLSLSAAFAGLLAGLTWNLAGNIPKARIARDLQYFQHPLVVLVLVTAGAAATLSLDSMVFGATIIAAVALFRRFARWMISAGLIVIALALDAFRADARPDWAVTLLGAVVVGTVASEALALFLPMQAETK